VASSAKPTSRLGQPAASTTRRLPALTRKLVGSKSRCCFEGALRWRMYSRGCGIVPPRVETPPSQGRTGRSGVAAREPLSAGSTRSSPASSLRPPHGPTPHAPPPQCPVLRSGLVDWPMPAPIPTRDWAVPPTQGQSNPASALVQPEEIQSQVRRPRTATSTCSRPQAASFGF